MGPHFLTIPQTPQVMATLLAPCSEKELLLVPMGFSAILTSALLGLHQTLSFKNAVSPFPQGPSSQGSSTQKKQFLFKSPVSGLPLPQTQGEQGFSEVNI